MLTHLSLFSGIGGLDLAAEAAGFVTVGQCEWADYPTKVLEQHWPDVPRWRDIRTLTGENFYERTGLRSVDIISGGFPCQPFSVAGKQKGKKDDRYLWPEMLRVIRELKPRWVLGENVPGILRIAGWDVATSLEREGFDVVVFDFEAAAVGAPHRRERVAFVGNNYGAPGQCMQREIQKISGPYTGRICETVPDSPRSRSWGLSIQPGGSRQTNLDANRLCEDVADTESCGLERLRAGRERISRAPFKEGSAFGCCAISDAESKLGKRCEQRPEPARSAGSTNSLCIIGQWSVEPDVGRVANGVSSRVDRLKCLGNAVVPQQFYPIFAAIAEIEKERDDVPHDA